MQIGASAPQKPTFHIGASIGCGVCTVARKFWCFWGMKLYTCGVVDCVNVSHHSPPAVDVANVTRLWCSLYCSIDALFCSSMGRQILLVLPLVLAASSQAYDGAPLGISCR
jgi:hypothetical protein